MMNKWLRFLDGHIYKLPVWLVNILGLCIVAVVGFLDGITGSDYSFSVFYFVTVAFVAWYIGRESAILVALSGSVSWSVADIVAKRYHENLLALFWNDVVKLSLLLFGAYVISEIKCRLNYEEKLARTDQLTGIANRRRFSEVADDEIRRSRRYNDPFTVIYLDIDNFKTVNDTQGHSEGDRLLLQVASTITTVIRESDTVARLGGDEFGLLMPETDGDAAVTVATKIHAGLKAQIEQYWPVTFSIGMVTYLKAPASADEMIRVADQLMYEVKNNGKDELRHLIVT
ncbi:MAG TPA: GGDEF domain-containing protein [Geobacter sp.]|nr:GGDEF domain-containing protein [Geobacter sp.]HCE67096.1 GGDEF domain-containing protein [Geobacter sp.]